MTDLKIELIPGAVKAAMKGVQSGDLWMVDIASIHVLPGFNVRVQDENYRASVREYANSMLANGYYRDKPMAGYIAQKDGLDVIYITDGHTRLDAVKLANLEGAAIEKIPLVTKNRGTDMIDLTVSLATSNSGKSLRPHELAQVCKRLIGYGLDTAKIAHRISMTKPYVDGLLKLVEAPQQVQEMVKSGDVSATLAIETIKQHGAKAGAVLADGKVKAAAAGKVHITKKHIETVKKIKKPEVKPSTLDIFASADKTDAPADDAVNQLLKKGVNFILGCSTLGLAGREGAVQILAYLAGVEESDVLQKLGV